VPDVSKLEALTGWRAQRSLAQILDDVIDEVRSQASLEPIRATSGERLQQGT
jgi:nucleoside-diphosphate-sugar epimerase